MALKLEVQTSVGIPCSYWLISRIEKDKISKTAFIILYGYPSKEIRDSGANFLERKFLNIYPNDYDKVFGLDLLNRNGINDYKNVYEFIKSNFEEFKNAEDI